MYTYPYFVEDYVSFDTVGEYVVLDIEFHDEEAADWAEGEGWLDSMIQLRGDILQRDYRALYLAWLKALEMEDVLDSVTEPPVPPGLKKLSPALRSFAEFFEIDTDLIQATAEGSGQPETTSEDDLRRAIAALSTEERAAFLLRLAKGEPQLSVAFNRRLGELIGSPGPDAARHRTVGQLLAAAEAESERARKQLAAEAEAKHVAEMEALAAREPQAWRDVDTLIQAGNATSYQKAVALLTRLKALAEYRDQEDAFQERLNQIYDQYARRKALLRRLRDAGLTES
jgi:hypothetical protein